MNGVLIAAPVMLPVLAGTATLLFRLRRRSLGAGISVASCAALLVIAITLMGRAAAGPPQTYALGNWPAPFGIVLVLDQLSALMLVLTAVLALAVAVHAVLTGLDRKGWHFHALFQFQLLGVNGAFLTGDLFNLFVFFEVFLIASYGLMLHGQGAKRLTAGVQYVIVNLVGSSVFLVALGLLYGITGTLNMADMAGRAALLPEGDRGIFQAGAFLLIMVFALKAALLPLHLWLPRTYANAAPAVSAMFAIMTKVGAYAIIRTSLLIFGDDAGAFLLPAALLTMVLGYAGMLAARNMRDMAAFGLLGSTATLLAAIALFDETALAAALYYLLHTTLAGGLLFLMVDIIIRWRAAEGAEIVPTPAYKGKVMLGVLFFITAIGFAGLPPLSGFIGKLLILAAAAPHPLAAAVWAVILVTSLMGIVALARAGSSLFWKADDTPPIAATRPAPDWREAGPVIALLAGLAALAFAAGPITAYAQSTAAQLSSPAAYIDAVIAEVATGGAP
ncbi:MAG: monovalent cation/H+ antiporter subunit D [Erythrobacter sp.]